MNDIEPNFNSFKKNFKIKKNQLFWKIFKSDLDTPVSAYLKLCQNNKLKNSFLLESVQDGSYRGRYSVIGMLPDLIWKSINNEVFIKRFSNDQNFKKLCAKPLESLKSIIEMSKISFPKFLPPMSSALIGYLGYETIEQYERLPKRKVNVLNLPDGYFIRPTVMAIFDSLENKLIITSPSWYKKELNLKKEYNEKIDLINKIKSNLEKSYKVSNKRVKKEKIKPKSNISKSKFINMVKSAKKHIFEGDIFQVVLSQRFKAKFKLPPFELYRSLRSLNPSPFLFFLNFKDDKYGEFALVGSSPEILVKLEDNKITIRPIAGTRPRGTNKKQDEKYKKELLEDPKELSEHLMLLDLGRNDVGRVSIPGSVKVTDKMIVELYSHVMHIVSNVEGKVKSKNNILNILMSGFPAGTVSGAPKIRAMEIINKLEPSCRGIYAGCVGYFSGNGDMETCIVLRTAILKNQHMYVQAGAGIVADSKPEKEYEETINKAKALFKAAESAME
ncbi:MAG: Anthranilate synthase component 1 [Alphaproteobacteria bacterium MarineAlpha9_Bin4]|nr:anthranilate synthase component I [Pelagibacterales bacterium]PPR27620.1 MAG: Anthranilate synthase component 1 [Alphaproteobacteria bacterium MarineAlpha9_Bin4]